MLKPGGLRSVKWATPLSRDGPPLGMKVQSGAAEEQLCFELSIVAFGGSPHTYSSQLCHTVINTEYICITSVQTFQMVKI